MTLRELIARWIATRDPRVADVVDRIGATVVVAPLAGKTLGAKVEAFVARAALGDPDDVSLLVAFPFPKGIRALEKVANALIALPEDPRVARRLTDLVVERPVDSLAGRAVIARAARRLAALRDVRAIPRLTAISIANVYRLEQMGIPVTIGKLAQVEVQPVDDDLLAPFALPDRDGALEATLLAQVLANPDDDAPRVVLGDYLVERGDPRGELFVLQLAGDRGKRVGQLLEAHGAQWATPMKRWFKNRRHWVFERGCFAGGRLDFAVPAAEVASEPAWALVRVVSTVRLAMIDGWGAQLRELHLDVRDPDELSYARFPALAVLGIDGAGTATWCATAPVVERLARLVVRDATTEVLEVLAARPGVREVELARAGDRFRDPVDWCVRISRTTAPGPFTHVTATRADGSREKVRELGIRLAPIPASWVRELVATSRTIALDADGIADAEAMLGRFAQAAKVVVPWLRPGASAPPGLAVRYLLPGPVLDERLGPVLAALAAFDQRYDRYSSTGSSTLRPLGKDPRARIEKWAKAGGISLERSNGEDALYLVRYETRGTLVARGRTLAELRSCFFELLALSGATSGVLGGEFALAFDDLAHGIYRGWIVVVPPHIAADLGRDAIAALATRPLLAGLEVLPGERLAIQLAASPEQVTEEMIEAFRIALLPLVARGFVMRCGYEFRRRVREVFDPIAERLRLTIVHERPLALRYLRDDDMIDVRLSNRLTFDATVRCRGVSQSLANCDDAPTAAQFEALLARVVRGVEAAFA